MVVVVLGEVVGLAELVVGAVVLANVGKVVSCMVVVRTTQGAGMH